jgi:hypothetical protein
LSVPPEALINGLVRCRYSCELQSSVVRIVITQKKILKVVAQGAPNLRGTNYTPSPAEYHAGAWRIALGDKLIENLCAGLRAAAHATRHGSGALTAAENQQVRQLR